MAAGLDPETAAQFAALGVSVPEVEVEAAAETEIWDVNWNAVGFFAACATQWRVAAGATAWLHLGLDYAGVEVAMRQLLPAEADPAQIFGDILVMEGAALPILNGGAA